MSSEWIAAGAAVAAAVIGPLVSLWLGRRQNATAEAIACRQVSASLISANRQAWIDQLRDTIAQFQSVLVNLGFRGGHLMERSEAEDQRYEKAFYRRSRVALLLNLQEDDHQHLLSLLDQALSRAYASGSEPSCEMSVVHNEITGAAQRILKREWIRVKIGEPDERDAIGRGKTTAMRLSYLDA